MNLLEIALQEKDRLEEEHRAAEEINRQHKIRHKELVSKCHEMLRPFDGLFGFGQETNGHMSLLRKVGYPVCALQPIWDNPNNKWAIQWTTYYGSGIEKSGFNLEEFAKCLAKRMVNQ